MAELAEECRVIVTDIRLTDTHVTEPPGLWTNRAPIGDEDRVE
jgi:hypothetical protein